MDFVIYKITNTFNGNVYIGQTFNFKQRMYQHRWALRNNKHCNRHLQSAYNKYGFDSLKFEIIEHCENREITNAQETYWFNYYVYLLGIKRVYNLSYTGNAHNSSLEIREKIRQKNIGKTIPENVRKKISNTLKGHASWNKGTKGVMKANKSSFKKGQNLGVNHPRARAINRYTLDGKLIKAYSTITEAVKDTGLSLSCIVCACQGKQKTSGNSIWKYVERN